MSFSFLSLPGELRNQIYQLVLLDSKPIDPWSVGFNQLTPGLFRVNKTIHHEATPLFYLRNCFDFTSKPAEDVDKFLRQTGQNNAAYIRHVRVGFPDLIYDWEGRDTLKNTVDIITSLQSHCVNLITLTTSLSDIDFLELFLAEPFNSNDIPEKLKLVDTHYKAIPSLQRILVELYGFGPKDYFREDVESLGWIPTNYRRFWGGGEE